MGTEELFIVAGLMGFAALTGAGVALLAMLFLRRRDDSLPPNAYTRSKAKRKNREAGRIVDERIRFDHMAETIAQLREKSATYKSNAAYRRVGRAMQKILTRMVNEDLLRECKLKNLMLDGASLQEADFSLATLDRMNLRKADLVYARFRESVISALGLNEASLQAADFSLATISESKMPHADLAHADFNKCAISSSSFNKAHLQEANFSEARLEDTQFNGALLQGAIFKIANLVNCHFEKADLTASDFHKASLYSHIMGTWDIGMKGARLDRANLQEASLINMSMENVSLVGADLSQATFKECRLKGSLLLGANLSQAVLQNCEFRGVNLRDAQLREATIEGCEFDTTTILPDSSRWKQNTDMARFTNPQHPDFWEPGSSDNDFFESHPDRQ